MLGLINLAKLEAYSNCPALVIQFQYCLEELDKCLTEVSQMIHQEQQRAVRKIE
ncbi:MAG TPA: hypothetical protein VIN08_19645 [Ohtaekwangia sp.]|uniref:hypothetical protein n=1 Tax=Ohtaekwangia sp. TaxID=2066019 RepID=UPI002F959DBF